MKITEAIYLSFKQVAFPFLLSETHNGDNFRALSHLPLTEMIPSTCKQRDYAHLLFDPQVRTPIFRKRVASFCLMFI